MSDVGDTASVAERPAAELVQSIAAAIRDIIRLAETAASPTELSARAAGLQASCLAQASASQPPRAEATVTALLHRLLYREARRIWLEGDIMARDGAPEAALCRRRLSVRVSGVADALRGPLPISRPAQAVLGGTASSVASQPLPASQPAAVPSGRHQLRHTALAAD